MKVLVFLILSSFFTDCFSQKLLFHKNRYREVLYRIGDVISFQLEGNENRITDQIRGFEDSLIVFQYFEINPDKITHLYIDDKTRTWYVLRYKYEKILPIAGAGYLFLDLLNTGKLEKNTLVISGSLMAAGLLSRWLISRRIKFKGSRKLMIIE